MLDAEDLYTNIQNDVELFINLKERVRRVCSDYKVEWDQRSAMGVVMSSKGYPESYETGKAISGLDALADKNDIKVFHSGTILENENILTNGGRVLCVTALGDNLSESHKNAYSAAKQINWDGKYYRKDIGFRVMK